MLSAHSREKVATPLSISPSAKTGLAPAWLGTPNPSLAAEARGQ